MRSVPLLGVLTPLIALASLAPPAARADEEQDQAAFQAAVRFYDRKEYDLAIRMYEVSLAERTARLGGGHVEVGYLHSRLGHCYRGKKDQLAALSQYEKCLAILRNQLPF